MVYPGQSSLRALSSSRGDDYWLQRPSGTQMFPVVSPLTGQFQLATYHLGSLMRADLHITQFKRPDCAAAGHSPQLGTDQAMCADLNEEFIPSSERVKMIKRP